MAVGARPGFRRVLCAFSLAALLLAGGCSAPPFSAAGRVDVSSLAGLQQAIDGASPGETIVLAPGDYKQTRPIHIHGKHDLTLTGATRDYTDTVIRGPGMAEASLPENIRIDHSDGVTIENLTVRDSYYHGIQIGNDSDHFRADHVRTLDNGESGFKVTSPAHASGASAYSDHGTIENCWIGFTGTGRRGVVEGVDIVAGNDWRLLANHFANVRRADGGPAYAAFAKGGAENAVFAGNTVEHSFVGLSFGGGGTSAEYFRNGDTRYETRGGTIRDNVIHDTDDTGIYLNKAHDFRVTGNIVLRTGDDTGAIESRFPESSGSISDNRVSSPIKTRDGSPARIGRNRSVPISMLLSGRRDNSGP